LSEDFLILWVEIPDLPVKTTGTDIGMDVGLNKLLAFSDRTSLGHVIKSLCQKVARREPGSNGKFQARKERDEYINHTLNQIPWTSIKTLAVENLKNLKRGKKPSRGKSFRKAIAPWTYAYVLERAKLKAAENRVLVVEVSPSYTSQTCPECGHRARQSRNNERFSCVRCGHADDADFVGARNILAKALGEPMVPRPPVVQS
jgi:putative transposase